MSMLSRPPSFGEQFAKSLTGGLSSGYESGQKFKQQLDLAKQKQQLVQKENENAKFSLGLQTLDQMKELITKGNIGTSLGIGALGNPFRNLGETGRDRENFTQLGRSLIPLVAAGVPIRNQREFDEYKKTITNPDATPEQLEGAIDGLQNIFTNKLTGDAKSEAKTANKIKFNPSNKEHRAKRDQLMKKFKGDQEKVREILSKEYEE